MLWHTLASLSLSGNWRLAFLSESDWLTDCPISILVCAMQFWLNFPLSFSLTLDRLMFFVCYSSSGIPSFLLQRHCVSRRRCSSACEYLRVYVSPPLSALSARLSSHPSIWSQQNYGDAMVPKAAWVLLPPHTNLSSPSLTDSPFTGWSIHRWLMDTHTCWRSQRSCWPSTTETTMVMIMRAVQFLKWFSNWFWLFS